MMHGYYILAAFIIASVSMTFGYILGSVMTTAKIADNEADKEREAWEEWQLYLEEADGITK